MAELTFKTFVWPSAPAHFQIFSKRIPEFDKDDTFTGLGALHRTIRGDGCFTGSGACAAFQALQALMEEGAAGTLTHPVFGSFTAFLTEVSTDRMPGENLVQYSFVFQEADSGGKLPK